MVSVRLAMCCGMAALVGCVEAELEEQGEEACHDYRDNDSDGIVDCQDAGCAGLESCVAPPRECDVLRNSPAPTFAVARTRACSIEAGMLYCWGAPLDGSPDRHRAMRVGAKSDWVTVAVGSGHACAIDLVGALYCWGNNEHGQLGLGETGPFRAEPTLVEKLVPLTLVAVGDTHSCAITKETQDMLCWGSNEHGQLGMGNPEITEISTPTRTFHLRPWSRLALGPEQSCAIDDRSELYCWGHWQEGNQTDAWAPLAWFSKVCLYEVATSGGFACAIGDDVDFTQPRENWGVVLSCFGQNEFGQLGDYKPAGSSWMTIWDLDLGVKHPVSLTLGDQHGCALGDEGKNTLPGGNELVCWGDNPEGQRGTEDTEPYPTLVSSNWLEVHASGASTCARDAAGKLFCTGDNRRGQCGSGEAMTLLTFTQVQGLPMLGLPARE